MPTNSKLTATAAAKLGRLSDAVDDAQNSVALLMRRIREAEGQIRTLGEEAEPEQRAALDAEIQRLHSRRESGQGRHAHLARQVAEIRSWLSGLAPDIELRDVPVVEWRRDESDDLQELVQIVRIEIDELMSTRRSVVNSVPPVEDLYLQADAHVEALARDGVPRVSIENDRLRVQHGSSWGNSGTEAIAMQAWLCADQLKDALHARIDELRADELRRGLIVMHPNDRKKRLADLEYRLRTLELEEEFYIVRAEENGITIPRRDRVGPAAILGVALWKKGALRAA